MATKMWFGIQAGDAGPNFTGGSDWKMRLSQGTGTGSNSAFTTTASGDHILSDNGDVFWLQIAAVTISGTISFNIYAFENAMATNATPGVRIVRCDSSGAEISDVVANANAGHKDDVESGTASAVQTWTATPTSTTFADGDYLKIIPHADAFGTMAAGTLTQVWDQASVGSNGDSWVSFTETITAFTPASFQSDQTILRVHPQLLAH